jgi:hypothetical protein
VTVAGVGRGAWGTHPATVYAEITYAGGRYVVSGLDARQRPLWAASFVTPGEAEAVRRYVHERAGHRGDQAPLLTPAPGAGPETAL